MGRKVFWGVVVACLALKWLGASWDVASHFRTTQDTANPAHFVNLAGNLLLAVALITLWRRHEPAERRPLMAAIASMAVVGLAVPLDTLWHEIHGLDLTTWSPTHMLLFYGTAAVCASLAMLLLAQVGWQWNSPEGTPRPQLSPVVWALLALLLARTLAPLLFPASFNEFAVVAAENLSSGQSIYRVDATLVEFAANFRDMPYGDLPHALYPAYTLGIATAFFVAVRRLSGIPGLASATAAIYVLGRVVPDLVAHAAGYPVSALPFHVLLVGLAVDLAWPAPGPAWMRGVLAGVAATALAYAFWAFPADLPRRVPLDWATVPWSLAAAGLGGGMAALVPLDTVLRWGRRLDGLVPPWVYRLTLPAHRVRGVLNPRAP